MAASEKAMHLERKDRMVRPGESFLTNREGMVRM
jgi:hypothetical protein